MYNYYIDFFLSFLLSGCIKIFLVFLKHAPVEVTWSPLFRSVLFHNLQKCKTLLEKGESCIKISPLIVWLYVNYCSAKKCVVLRLVETKYIAIYLFLFLTIWSLTYNSFELSWWKYMHVYHVYMSDINWWRLICLIVTQKFK